MWVIATSLLTNVSPGKCQKVEEVPSGGMAAYMGLIGLSEGAFSQYIDNQTIIETIFFIDCNVSYLNFYISSKPWFYTSFFTIS